MTNVIVEEFTNPIAQPQSAVVVEEVVSNTEPESAETAAAAATEDAPKAEDKTESEEAEQDPRMSARFAALAKKERTLVQKEKELRTHFDQREQRLKNFEVAWGKAKENPMLVFQELGLTLDDLATFVLNDNQPTEASKVKQIEAKLAAMEAAEEQAKVSAQQAQVQQTINNFRYDIRNVVNANTDKYELVHVHGAYEDVLNVVDYHLRETGQLLSIDQAAEMVEKYLTTEAEKILKAKKFAKVSSPEATSPVDAKNSEVTAKPTKTMTNKQVASATPVQTRRLTKEESIKELSKKFNFWKE